MTRFAEPGARFPSCQMTHHAVKARDAPEGRAVWWFRNVEFLPHGPAHRGIGGTLAWGFGAIEAALREAGVVDRIRELLPRKSTSADLAHVMATVQPFALHRVLWRHHLIDFPAWCAADAPVAACVARVVPGGALDDEALGRELVRNQV